MLKTIKIIHTIIWAVMAAASFYILYAGIFKVFNWYLYASLFLLLAESLVLLLNKWVCPLTPMAMKYTSNREPDFDIYLPKVIAKYNKQIFGTIFAVGLILVLVNYLMSS